MHRRTTRAVRAVVLAFLIAAAAAIAAAPANAAGGFNASQCRPSTSKPEPVVLLHGLGGNKLTNWVTIGPRLASEGYCVYSTTYGKGIAGELAGGLRSMRSSSKEVATFVDDVRARTGAAKVNLVGYSEGTTVAAYYMKFDGGGAKVKRFVGFGSNFKGTTLYGLNQLVRTIPAISNILNSGLCEACDEFLPPSALIDDLNRGGVTVPGPQYTSIVTKFDNIIRSYTSGILDEPGVKNVVLQNECRLDVVSHLALPFDPNVYRQMRKALDPEGAPRPGCVPFFAPV